VTGAVEAMRLGALDYLVKPFDPAELPLVIARANARANRRAWRNIAGATTPYQARVSFSARRWPHWRSNWKRFSPPTAGCKSHLPPVLIQGETGTGKTAIARWLHHHGPRAGQALVEMNCSAVPTRC